MKLQPWVASVLVAIGVASCGENSPPPAQTANHGDLTANRAGPAPIAVGHPSGSGPSARLDAPVPPKGAQNTIMCDAVAGPGHIENATMLRSRLVQASGLSDWYVIHGEKESTLYFGYYGSMENAGEKKRAEVDRARIAALTDRLGNPLVRGGVIVPLNAADPEAPAAWNLLNTPKNAYWTIEIATFAQNAKRKEAAVEMVRQLREHGENEAFYFHGPTVSSVCIGAWPREAVAEQGTGIDKSGNMRDDAHAQTSDQPLLVFAQPPGPNLSPNVREPGTGRRMAVEAPKLEIESPDMKRKVADYPYHYVNYLLHGTQNGAQTFPDQSVLVAIPRDQSGTGEDDYRLNSPPSEVQSQEARHKAPSSAGDDVLRSFGDH